MVKAVAPKPVNFLNGGAFGLTVDDLAAMGVRRISVGGALARSAWGGFMRAATEIAERARSTALPAKSASRAERLFQRRRDKDARRDTSEPTR